jgi:hypothetical protein
MQYVDDVSGEGVNFEQNGTRVHAVRKHLSPDMRRTCAYNTLSHILPDDGLPHALPALPFDDDGRRSLLLTLPVRGHEDVGVAFRNDV